ncbi:Lipopolysaccharide export system protein [Desulfonema limicola]|uniref:Lipopolysaccharide export system protein n=1 Tax=Desulfonema limicola TaxID=45656 RepID=A0A975B4H2_9BACT|nr:LPS export ABC transporter periplasmic protein LptC [Desulfonema limicola]QTA78618.1 Lipopolysaccharide export system protein [Desulfonema limicola]
MKKDIKSKKLKIVLISVIITALFGVLSVFTIYRQVLNKTSSMTSSISEGTTMAMQSIYQTAVKDGVTEWSMDAASANYLESENQAVFQEPVVTFFLKDNTKASLSADSGIIKTDSRDINVFGNVILKNQGYLLKTNKLQYKHDQKVFLTETHVEIFRNDFDLSADSAYFDLNSKKIIFKGNVKGTFGEGISL